MLAMLETAERAFGLEVDEHFAVERVRAFCEAPDSATRVLKGRYLRADLRPYMDRLRTRLGSAGKMAAERGIDIDPFMWAFEEVVEAIGEGDSFLDVTVVDPATGRLTPVQTRPRISRRIDVEVEAAFAAALDGWAPVRSAAILRRRLQGSLATWRDE